MIDVHAPHQSTHTWSDFLIHIATIVVGLFIAIGLEQAVELLHRSHQRHQLQEDLRTEAENNRTIIAHDLRMQDLEPWFDRAINAVASAAPQQGTIQKTSSRGSIEPSTPSPLPRRSKARSRSHSPSRPAFPAPLAPPPRATSLRPKPSGPRPKRAVSSASFPSSRPACTLVSRTTTNSSASPAKRCT